MHPLPPELEPRREAILERVRKRGRHLHRRRVTAIAASVAIIATALITVGVAAGHDNEKRLRVAAIPSTTQVATTTDPAPGTTVVPTTAPEPTTPTAPPVTTPPSEPATTTPTTALVCRNSSDPACGPFRYDPPLENEPLEVRVVSVTPSEPHAGDRVTFRLHARDADSFLGPDDFCGTINYGDDLVSSCIADCVGEPMRYGAWDPPPARPSERTYELEHVYDAAGSFTAQFTLPADLCGPRPAEESVKVRIEVLPRP